MKWGTLLAQSTTATVSVMISATGATMAAVIVVLNTLWTNLVEMA
jgi:hypothetical protein